MSHHTIALHSVRVLLSSYSNESDSWYRHMHGNETRTGTGNGTGAIGNQRSWSLSLSLTSDSKCVFLVRLHRVPLPMQLH